MSNDRHLILAHNFLHTLNSGNKAQLTAVTHMLSRSKESSTSQVRTVVWLYAITEKRTMDEVLRNRYF